MVRRRSHSKLTLLKTRFYIINKKSIRTSNKDGRTNRPSNNSNAVNLNVTFVKLSKVFLKLVLTKGSTSFKVIGSIVHNIMFVTNK